jgi:hypothetical protein
MPPMTQNDATVNGPARTRDDPGVVVVLALMGAVLYGLAALDSGRAAALAIAYLGQALPLLTDPVRRHVHARP